MLHISIGSRWWSQEKSRWNNGNTGQIEKDIITTEGWKNAEYDKSKNLGINYRSSSKVF